MTIFKIKAEMKHMKNQKWVIIWKGQACMSRPIPSASFPCIMLISVDFCSFVFNIVDNVFYQ